MWLLPGTSSSRVLSTSFTQQCDKLNIEGCLCVCSPACVCVLSMYMWCMPFYELNFLNSHDFEFSYATISSFYPEFLFFTWRYLCPVLYFQTFSQCKGAISDLSAHTLRLQRQVSAVSHRQESQLPSHVTYINPGI